MEDGRTNLKLISSDACSDNIQSPVQSAPSSEGTHAEQHPPSTPLQTEPLEEKAGAASNQLSRQRLVNKLNYLNFQDATILVTLKHTKYNHTIALKAKPQPCQDGELACRWSERKDLERLLRTYRFENLLVPDGQKLFQVHPHIINIDADGLRCRLPQSWREVSLRKVQRYPCRGIKVQVLQHSSLFNGRLLDFNAVSFRVSLKAVPPQNFQWINTDARVTVILSNDKETIYSGECRIIQQLHGLRRREFVLEPVNNEIQRFKHKKYRSVRQRMQPAPDIVFIHPFTGKLVDLKAVDLSGTGLAVEEETHNAVLLPGMIVPEMELSLADSIRIKCKAQVVYRKLIGDHLQNRRIKCGFTILDMDAQAHLKLLALLQQADDKKSYVCNQVDLDALWDFFFETGFIYPDKYEYIQRNKSSIKETYRKLYSVPSNISRHFIYQDQGLILGHMAMVRFYNNTWLIHHHAARSSVYNRAGLLVLNQIGRFGNAAYRLHSMHMDFLMCFYRQNNKFPHRLFSGAVKSIKDPKGCSEDTLAYLHFEALLAGAQKLPSPWDLSETTEEDLQELERFYEHISGGLMLHALNLSPGSEDQQELALEYRKMGFRRERHLFTLKCNDHMKAVFMVNFSDIGLNLSDLTNAVTAIVVDPEGLTADNFRNACFTLGERLDCKNMPVLVYPTDVMQCLPMPYDKLYSLWILDCQYGDPYFSYLDRLVKYVKS